mmetsp:Transcript_17388/g.39247  ORF Transcript_17388/g.39247 Transcript_17388/m.39247 type:complete len:235 (+) Transcript_17388:410-1114(+)
MSDANRSQRRIRERRVPRRRRNGPLHHVPSERDPIERTGRRPQLHLRGNPGPPHGETREERLPIRRHARSGSEGLADARGAAQERPRLRHARGAEGHLQHGPRPLGRPGAGPDGAVPPDGGEGASGRIARDRGAHGAAGRRRPVRADQRREPGRAREDVPGDGGAGPRELHLRRAALRARGLLRSGVEAETIGGRGRAGAGHGARLRPVGELRRSDGLSADHPSETADCRLLPG